MVSKVEIKIMDLIDSRFGELMNLKGDGNLVYSFMRHTYVMLDFLTLLVSCEL